MSSQSGTSAQMSEVPSGGTGPRAVSPARPFARPSMRPQKALQYEVNVVATDLVAMVSEIGGWLFDRSMAGWRVGVAAGRQGSDGDCADERALRILGLTAVEGDDRSPGADTVTMTAIGTDHFDADGAALRTAHGDVVFFGPQGPGGLTGGLHRLQYRPSAAALAFKAQALAVVGANPSRPGAVETMFGYGRSAGLLDADLVPVR